MNCHIDLYPCYMTQSDAEIYLDMWHDIFASERST